MRTRIWIAVVCMFTLLAAGCGAKAQGEPTADAVRLHVVAHSDAGVDQELKYEVRDAVLEAMDADWTDARSCFDDLCARSLRLEEAANEVIAAQGFDYTARVETGVYDFPTRVYGDAVWPAGRYLAVRVVLGAGEGRNWWCVIYPALCMNELAGGDVDAVTGAAPDPDDDEIVVYKKGDAGRKISIRSWTWENWVPSELRDAFPGWFRWEFELNQ